MYSVVVLFVMLMFGAYTLSPKYVSHSIAGISTVPQVIDTFALLMTKSPHS